MKKVLAGLISISFLAVLLVPTTILAATCPDCQKPSANCDCGANILGKDGGLYCFDETVYDTLSGCTAAMNIGGGTSGSSAGQQQIPGEGQVPSTPGEIVALIEDIGDWIFTALLVVAAIFLVIAGYRFVFAGGNEENVKKARQMLLNALIGVAVALGAKGLVAIIGSLVKS